MLNTLLFIGGLGAWEIALIMLIVLVFFGAKRIPELARGVGRGIREFKDATSEVRNSIESEGKKEDTSAPKKETQV
ncbi:twin arginine-targeting protein translocase, TatA/E family [Bernardetia litoralis DSM 6794]|uniref:Sec-independent protein translocase protein TatA n=1 Tax=Bernardetia litoralis (strain ATCC 23117 / DSM 6794 / NBRC 15988 / NCIMB 1366 / Fx l1 / Sio-4) TaxID=880071 RepID=I4AKV0_BERLS|nr:twin-arginine translocase TatA/TatE family subunit [Bernardetia litoralis]AFM04585.1 twin arginine-targeting protein translocase, TatA/E family [Bernardetia litoralis DSM 6794]